MKLKFDGDGFRAIMRQTGTALFIAGIAGGEVGEIGGTTIKPHIVIGVIVTGVIIALFGLFKKQEVST